MRLFWRKRIFEAHKINDSRTFWVAGSDWVGSGSHLNHSDLESVARVIDQIIDTLCKVYNLRHRSHSYIIIHRQY